MVEKFACMIYLNRPLTTPRRRKNVLTKSCSYNGVYVNDKRLGIEMEIRIPKGDRLLDLLKLDLEFIREIKSIQEIAVDLESWVNIEPYFYPVGDGQRRFISKSKSINCHSIIFPSSISRRKRMSLAKPKVLENLTVKEGAMGELYSDIRYASTYLELNERIPF